MFETTRGADGGWSSGPKWLPPKTNIPEWKEHARTAEAGWAARYPLAVRVVELAAARVADFAGHADEQMRIGGVLTGTCACCGRMLTDPVSVERGIGPECWAHSEEVRRLVERLAAE
jgi:hypothetical protein